jgi:hypothetical protein
MYTYSKVLSTSVLNHDGDQLLYPRRPTAQFTGRQQAAKPAVAAPVQLEVRRHFAVTPLIADIRAWALA